MVQLHDRNDRNRKNGGDPMMQHEGKLSAIVRRTPCKFDGNVWTTPDRELTELLNWATNTTPKTHSGIRELAEIVLRKVKLWDTAEILRCEQVDKIDEIPPGGIP